LTRWRLVNRATMLRFDHPVILPGALGFPVLSYVRRLGNPNLGP
jgi:hypothetical protein